MTGDEQGFALAFTLVVLAALTAGTLVVTTLATSAARQSRTVELQHRSDAAAEGAAEVMLDLIAQAETATSMPSFTVNMGGMAAAASASLDQVAGVWTVRATAGGHVVQVRARREDGRLVRIGWGTGAGL